MLRSLRLRQPEPAAVLDLIDRRAMRVFAVLAAVAFATLLYLGRHGSFYHDEWTFIGKSGGTLSDWFGPHNEHWSTVPFLIYRVLLGTVGLTTYLPYLAILLALHVAAVASLFVLVRRMSGTLVALAASAIFLFLGSGADDLFWAFQIGFVSSAAAGLGALAALSNDRPRTASVLLLVAIASSSTGLPFVAAAVVMLLVDPARRRQLAWLVPVVAVFLVWFVLIGRSGVAEHEANLSPEALALLPEFTAFGVADSIDAAFGLARPLGALLGALVIGWALIQARARSLDVRAVAAAVGLVVLFVLIGLGRGQFGVEQAARSRYLYFGVAFGLLGLAAVLGGRAEAVARRIGSRQRVTPAGAVTGALVVLLAGNGLLVNALLLPASAEFFAQAAGELRAFIALADRYGSALPYRPPPITRIYIPAPAILRELFGTYGSPTSDALVPSVVRPPSPIERDRALWDLTGGLLEPHRVPSPTAAAGPPPTVEGSSNARLSIDTGCMLVRSTAGSAGTVTLRVPEGSFVLVMVAEGGDGAVRLGRDAPPDGFDQLGVSFPAGRWLRFDPPRVGDGSVFGVQLVLPAGSTARICSPPA